ncbi:hypothetical protein PPERSA_06174 [Pseudocohnilembus persalinus]|uniref:Ubiquitin-like protease family profile domain-containing protein n=1 Tax=Pseudocohnilembus persalinus TaxID=266149 RepID=A0A0V0R0E6_PSEPJ|nr:hypothetical protein PPERSA_06174 [Pseudocohnilembus persalinus]|eukprot:KRX07996.1 hypothetical protein PPERSA_06174 [Pseudocohnilembus persalinus]
MEEKNRLTKLRNEQLEKQNPIQSKNKNNQNNQFKINFKEKIVDGKVVRYIENLDEFVSQKDNIDEDIIAQRYGITIKSHDVSTLQGLNWLNDNVINFFVNLLREVKCKAKQNINDSIKSQIFVSQYLDKMTNFPQNLQETFITMHNNSITKRKKTGTILDNYHRNFFIVNRHQSHWVMIEISKKSDKEFDIIIYDSYQTMRKLDNGGVIPNITSKEIQLEPILIPFYDCLFPMTEFILYDQKNSEQQQQTQQKLQQDKSEFIFNYHYPPVPQQTNLSDCGVFTTFFTSQCFFLNLNPQKLIQKFGEVMYVQNFRKLMDKIICQVGKNSINEQQAQQFYHQILNQNY